MRLHIMSMSLSLAALSLPAIAQPTAPPPRARGPALALAIEAAQTAIQTCLASGYRTTALVADAEGVPVVLLSADGASAMTQTIATGKIAIVVKYKLPSGTIAERLKTDTALAAEIKADPRLRFAWPGAYPLMAGTEQIGAIAVSGAPGGDKDEACARPAVEKIAARLR
jgi:uncharacterized protein GlcG (DUF336 family)